METKEMREIYKRHYKEIVSKELKKDGFIQVGEIRYYRLNKLFMLEYLDFQRHYDMVTVNYNLLPLSSKDLQYEIVIGNRIGKLMPKDCNGEFWWRLETEEEIIKSLTDMVKVIREKLYKWYKKMENEELLIRYLKKIISNYPEGECYLATSRYYFLLHTYLLTGRYDKIEKLSKKIYNLILIKREKHDEIIDTLKVHEISEILLNYSLDLRRLENYKKEVAIDILKKLRSKTIIKEYLALHEEYKAKNKK